MLITDSPDAVRSVHGDSTYTAPGIGSPAAFRAPSVASVAPPPAESPAMVINAGSTSAMIARYAATQSSIAAG